MANKIVRWTESERRQLAILWLCGSLANDIAIALDRTVSAVVTEAKRMGLGNQRGSGLASHANPFEVRHNLRNLIDEVCQNHDPLDSFRIAVWVVIGAAMVGTKNDRISEVTGFPVEVIYLVKLMVEMATSIDLNKGIPANWICGKAGEKIMITSLKRAVQHPDASEMIATAFRASILGTA